MQLVWWCDDLFTNMVNWNWLRKYNILLLLDLNPTLFLKYASVSNHTYTTIHNNYILFCQLYLAIQYLFWYILYNENM